MRWLHGPGGGELKLYLGVWNGPQRPHVAIELSVLSGDVKAWVAGDLQLRICNNRYSVRRFKVTTHATLNLARVTLRGQMTMLELKLILIRAMCNKGAK